MPLIAKIPFRYIPPFIRHTNETPSDENLKNLSNTKRNNNDNKRVTDKTIKAIYQQLFSILVKILFQNQTSQIYCLLRTIGIN